MKNSGKPRIFLTGGIDNRIAFSLGNYLFKSDTPSFFSSIAAPAVIIGRNQNPYTECNLEEMKKDEVQLIRRKSGGGAVWCDNGTSMNGFYGITTYPGFNKNNIDNIIIKSLNHFIGSPKAELVGKNDIKVLIDGIYYKIVGQAFEYQPIHSTSSSYFLHTNSILVDADMSKLSNYLKPNKLKMESKGTTSVRSHVKNIAELNPEFKGENGCYLLTSKLFENFMDFFNFDNCHITVITSTDSNDKHNVAEYVKRFDLLNPNVITADQLLEIDEIRNTFNMLCNKEWVYGKTPEFTHEIAGRFSWGTITIRLNVEKNIIKNIDYNTDSIYIEIPTLINAVLLNKDYSKTSINNEFNEALDKNDQEHLKQILDDVKNMIIKNMS
jgi:lipoate-protein ligase A